MRNNVKILIFSLLIHPFVSIGQTIQTFNHNVSTGYIGQGMDVEIDGPLIYQYYLDENKREVLHGKLTYNGSKSEKFYNGNLTAKGSYSIAANYFHGKLDGAVTIKKSYSVIFKGRSYSSNISFSGSLSKGVPIGEWKIVESGNLNPEFEFRDNFNKDVFGNVYGMNLSSNGVPIEANRSRSVTVRFNDGRLIYVLTKRANITQTNESIGADDSVIVNGTGTEKELINTFLSGKATKEDLINEGYLIHWYDAHLDDNELREYIDRLAELNYKANFEYELKMYKNEIPKYYLEKVELIPYEEALKILEEEAEKDEVRLKLLKEKMQLSKKNMMVIILIRLLKAINM